MSLRSSKMGSGKEGDGPSTNIRGGKKRQCLSQAEVRKVFARLRKKKKKNDGGSSSSLPPPQQQPHADFRIIVVSELGDGNGLKLSPPPYEYQEGVYVLLRLADSDGDSDDDDDDDDAMMMSTIPPDLSDRVLPHGDLASLPERPWSLSGPQYSGNTVTLQQRYCTPRGEDDEYRCKTKGAIWTLIDSDGKESFNCRVFHVYHSPSKRAFASTIDDLAEQVARKTSASSSSSPGSLKSKRRRKAPKSKKRPSSGTMATDARVSSKDDPEGAIATSSSSAGDAASSASARPKRQKRSPAAAAAGKQKANNNKPSSNGGNKRANLDAADAKARQSTRSWTGEEDATLARLYGDAGGDDPDSSRLSWNSLARCMMTDRSGKQCRERYVNHLRPDRKRGGWTEAEDAHIVGMNEKLGNQWSKIASGLPGRSDNDVKNRWHSRMRSMRRKEGRGGGVGDCDPHGIGKGKGSGEEKAEETTITERSKSESKSSSPMDDAATPREEGAVGSDAGPAAAEEPKVGQRVQVELNDKRKVQGGTITKVSLNEKDRYIVTISFDDGNTEDTFYPDKDIHLVPANSELTDNEVLLCQELLNLHSALQNPAEDKVDTMRNQVSKDESHGNQRNEEETNGSGQQVLMGSQSGSGGPSDGRGGGGCETGAEGSRLESRPDTRPLEKGTGDNEISRPTQPMLSNAAVSINDQAVAMASSLASPHVRAGPPLTSSPRAVLAQDPRMSALLNTCHPSALNFQAPSPYHPAPAPLFALPTQQHHQLVAAARLLSSVNPGLAVAALASARHIHNNNMSMHHHQGQVPGMFFAQQQLQLNGGFPRQFNYPQPMANLSVPGRIEPTANNQSGGDAVAARLANLPNPSSKTDR